MSRFQVQGRKVCVIFQLATLDKDLLSFRLDAGKGVELVFEDLARLSEIQLKLVTLSGMFYDN